ncbi:energy transducer TonB [Candidatus Poribacteria bacterium]|nr:energy transducer TonB [Candidatus Poribacteria bacterium]
MTTTYNSSMKKAKGDSRLNTLYYLVAVFLHLSLLIFLNKIEIKTNTGNAEENKKEETLILVKNLPPAPEKQIEVPKPISQALTRINTNAGGGGGGGGGGRIMIDGKLLAEEIKVDNSHLLKNMSVEDLQKILPDKGDEDLISENLKTTPEPKIKEKEMTRSKTTPMVAIKPGFRFGIKGGKGTVRSFESAAKAGLFGKLTGTGTGLGSGTGTGYGPGEGSGWGGGKGDGIGSGTGSGQGWEDGSEGYNKRDIDAIVKSDRIIKTTVRVFVLPDGHVDKVDLVKSSGFVELDNMAMSNAKQTPYDPLDLKPGDEEKMRIYDVEIEFSQIR